MVKLNVNLVKLVPHSDLKVDSRGKLLQAVQKSIRNNTCFVAKKSESIVGTIISESLTLEEYLNMNTVYPQMKVLFQYLIGKRSEPMPGNFLRIRIITVSKNEQQQGIAGKLTDFVLRWAKSEKIGAAVTEATGLYSQSAFEKRGMKCISEVKYSEYKDANGEVIFEHTDPHPSVKLMLIKF